MTDTDATDATDARYQLAPPTTGECTDPTFGSTVWAEIDLGALEANVRTLRGLAPSSEFMAVVKADAYGHGLLPVAHLAQRAGFRLRRRRTP